LTLYPTGQDTLPQHEQDVLIARCKAGDRQAWDTLIHCHEKLIFRFALSLAGNATDASDVTAEVYLRLVHGLETYRQDAASFKSWLFRIIRNTYIDVCIRNRNHGHLSLNELINSDLSAGNYDLIDKAPTPETLCLNKEQRMRISEGIQHLPTHQRQALALFIRGFSYEEMAVRLGVSIGTIKSRLNRARNTLRMRLEAAERHYPLPHPLRG